MLITLDELIAEEALVIPVADAVLSSNELKEGARFESRGGVYTFYNKYLEPLYIGISVNVGKRVMEHFGTPKGNKDLCQYIERETVYISVFYEDRKIYQEIYESYLIKVMSPRFNVDKTGRQKV
ncbi:nucleotide excision repair endonuclease [Bacillus atrophaeus]|uniref:nucleotide excision repair endonuclease n=1 Tax=Bacillus atrophaeus TaxID=1452 RepID=UPI001239EBA0|nr:nucleotide excision repair endonuclease [Bacillus atrophaeus]KAA6455017.1 nucleotide excision repair endonuclease [Bacillus atrophaeus]MED4819185.1 nucleotide excision repair endonuclease [Bacillus atrophaeus]MED4827655.1 nucleotide excision repair endonuclease [Bacillus atrophaeus]